MAIWPIIFLCASEDLVGSEMEVRSWDFESEFHEISTPESSQSKISGRMPEGWEDNSAWADVDVAYGPLTNNPYAGEQSFRVDVGGIRTGTVQFRVPSLAVNPERFLRIRMAVRSPNSLPFRVALRQFGPPYKVYWQSTVSAAPEWGVVEMVATPGEVDPEAVLMVSLQTPGVLEIDDFSLTPLTIQEALGGRSFDGNLLPSSSFPLGVAAPWAAGGNEKPAHAYAADPEHPGPSGLPSLRMTSFKDNGRPMLQITTPFVGRPATTHTFSFWAKSDSPGQVLHVRMGAPGETLYRDPWQKNVELTSEWKRYHFIVMLPPSPVGFYICRLTSHEPGTIWVDQLMVEAAAEPGEFQRGAPVEIALVPESRYGLSFVGDPLRFQIAAFGDLKKVERIQMRVHDLYGNTVELPDVSLSGGGDDLWTETIGLPAECMRAFGSFVVEVTAVDADGGAVSRPAEVLLHRVRKPRYFDQDFEGSLFGVHVTPGNAPLAKALGFNWVRGNYVLNWSGVEPRPGEWTWEAVDATLAAYRAERLKLLAYLGGVPAWASQASADWKGRNVAWWRMTAAPRVENLDAWQEYARRIFERYGETLKAVENWNEPFLPGFFPVAVKDGVPVRGPASLFHQMAARVQKAATKASYPGKVFWNVGAAYGESERSFDTENVSLGTAGLVDGYTLHRYTNAPLNHPGDRFVADVATIRKTLGPEHDNKPIWNSEGGFGTSDLFNLYRHTPPLGLYEQTNRQADLFVRYFLSNFAAGIEKVFIYAFFDLAEWRPFYSFMNVDGRLSHLAPVMSNLAWQIDGKTFAGAATLPGDVQALLFEGAEENTVTLTSKPGDEGSQIGHEPAGIESADLYGNPPTFPHRLSQGTLFLRGKGLTMEDVTHLIMVKDSAVDQP